MIVVIGSASYRPGAGGPSDDAVAGGAAGLAVAVARAAVVAGSEVQLVTKVGDDAAGDAIVISLGHAGIGHAALLRDPGHPTPLGGATPLAASPDEEDDDGPIGILATGPDPAEAAEDGSPPPGDGLLPADPASRPALEAGDVEMALRYLPSTSVVVLADPLDPAAEDAVVAGAAWAGAQLIALVPEHRAVADGFADATVLVRPDADPEGAFARLIGGYAAALDRGVDPAEAFRSAAGTAGWERAANAS